MQEICLTAIISSFIIAICVFPIIIYLAKNKLKFNPKAIYNIYMIISIILLIPCLNIGITRFKDLKVENFNTDNFEKCQYIPETEEILNNNLSKNDVELEQIEKFQKINSINIENNYIYRVYNVVPKLWGSIACLIFIYNLLVYKIYIFKLNLIEEKNLKIEELLNIQKNKMNINKNIKYAFSDKITTPITIGIINKKIIIPKSFEINDYKYILKHEIFHIKNKDVEFKFFCVVLESIYFFNPIIKYLTKSINEIIELNCDYNILLNESNLFRKEYGNVLLRQIESRKEAQYKLIMSFASPRRKIMERFKNIIDEGARKKCFTILGVMSCLIIISLIVLAFIPNINVATTEKNNIATPVLTEYKSSNDLEYVNELNTEIKENVKNEFETNKIEKNEIKSEVDLNSEEIKDNQNKIKSDKDTVEENYVEEIQKNTLDMESKLNDNNQEIIEPHIVSKEVDENKDDVVESSKIENKDEIQKNPETENIAQENKEVEFVENIASENNIKMKYPLKSIHTITKNFGGTSNHSGIDYRANSGEKILAAANGKVVFSGYEGSYGNYIIIDHGNGIKTMYAHCSTLLKKTGSQVNAGEEIAEVGSTGFSTGPHLHFEVKVNEKPVDPKIYLQ